METVKRYAAHEEEVFTQVAEAELAGAGTPAEAAAADAQMTSALSRLHGKLSELKANQNFIQLQMNWPVRKTALPPPGVIIMKARLQHYHRRFPL